MRRVFLRNLWTGGMGAAALALLTAHPGLAAHTGGDVVLRDVAGNPLSVGSTEPYSPRQTCGACHDYATVTKGYHFQQGWDELYDGERKAEKPWVHGPGMAGKW